MHLTPFPATALLALACAPFAGAQGFQDITSQVGLSSFPHSAVPRSAGMACGDFDADGDLDLILPENPGRPLRYFRNDGNMSFTDVSATAGLGLCGLTRMCLAADIDNDGDQDLFVGNWHGAPKLFLNDGQARFVDVAVARGLTHVTSCYSATFGDFDKDGWLDLYIGNYADTFGQPEANILYRNTGNGFFVDVTASAGVAGAGLTWIASFLDYNFDGLPDIYSINDKGYARPPCKLYENRGDGTFADVSVAMGADLRIDAMGIDFVDIFNDGGLDLYVSDGPPDHHFLHWDEGRGRYVDETATYGLQGTGAGWAIHYLDYDNDGWMDLHVVQNAAPNLLFKNPGQPASARVPWTDQAASLGTGTNIHQLVMLSADLDNDGGVDIIDRLQSLVTPTPLGGVIFHRNAVPRGHWLKLDLEGTVSNRDGVGALIEVTAGGIKQMHQTRRGYGFQDGSDPREHFGLGAATRADLVEITWPSGLVQILRNVPADQILEVTEPRFHDTGPAPSGQVPIGQVSTLELSAPNDAGSLYAMVLALGDQPGIPLPDGRRLPVNPDLLFSFSIAAGAALLPNGTGFLPPGGSVQAGLALPNDPLLRGLRFYATAFTLGVPPTPWRTVFPEGLELTIY